MSIPIHTTTSSNADTLTTKKLKVPSKIVLNITDKNKSMLASQYLRAINKQLIQSNDLPETPANGLGTIILEKVDATHTDTTVIVNFIDACGLPCPQPLLKAKIALRSINKGDYVYLIATDKNSKADIQAYAKHAGIDLYLEQSYSVESDENIKHDKNNDGFWHFFLSPS